jgi:hypothetical protein
MGARDAQVVGRVRASPLFLQTLTYINSNVPQLKRVTKKRAASPESDDEDMSSLFKEIQDSDEEGAELEVDVDAKGRYYRSSLIPLLMPSRARTWIANGRQNGRRRRRQTGKGGWTN